MGNLSKQKGKRGERELNNLLGVLLQKVKERRERIGLPRWQHEPQAFVDPQANDADISSIPGLAIEVKRQETLNLNTWWKQAERQADNLSAIPVVAYRQNRKKWQFMLPAYLLGIGIKGYIICEQDTFEDWLFIFLSE